MDDEQLRRLFQELNEATELAAAQEKLLGQVSKKTADDLKTLRGLISASGADLKKLAKATQDAADAEKKAKDETESYTKSLKDAGKGVANSGAGLAKSMASGSTDFAQFGGVIKSVSSAAGKLAGSIPLFGSYLDKAAQGLGDAAAFVMQQVDQITKVYAELGKVGGITVDGVDGLRQQFEKMGLVSLPAFADAVNQNAVAMAALGPTTARGAKMLGESLGQITDERGPFIGPLLKLGYTVDDITKIGSKYIGSQVLLGNRQLKTTDDLTKAMAKYLEEIDAVSRATGRSREQVLEERQKNLADVKFRARVEELQATGRGQSAEELAKLIDSLGGPVADVIRASAAGVPLTKEAQGTMALFRGQIQRSIEAINRGSTAEAERYKIMQAGTEGVKGFNKNLQFGAAEFLGSEGVVRQVYDWNQALRQGVDPFAIAKGDREGLKAQKGQTGAMVDAQIAIQKTGRTLQRLAFDALPMATTAAEAFATTLDTATNAIRKILGLPPSAGTGRGAAGFQAPAGGATGAAGLAGAAAKNLNPGNLRFAGQKGATMGTGGFARFESVDEGLVALANQLDLYLTGKSAMGQRDTIASIISTYAPPNENKTNEYINNVAKFMGMDPNTKLSRDPKTMAKLMTAIIGQENFGNPSRGYNFRGGVQYAVAKHLGIDPSQVGQFRFGGIADGPLDGYTATLHGKEAVVPLPDGRSIPVDLPGLEELVSLMRQQVSYSQKILQASHS